MDDRDRSNSSDARERARERLAARQSRMAQADGRRPAPGRSRTRPDGDASGRSRGRTEADGLPPAGRRGVSREDAGAPGTARRAFEAVRGFAGALGPRGLAVLAGVVLALVLLAFGVSSCVRACSAEQPALEQEDSSQDEGETAGDGAVAAPIALPEGLDADVAARLTEAAADNEDIAWIASHASDYAVDGEMVQYKLLKLAADEPEAVGFVRGFPEAYPSDAGEPYGESAESAAVPHLYQWDTRWGYTVYSSTTFALTGCCPTSLSMVYAGLTGKADITPYDMGVRAQNGGYMTQYNGTDGSFLVAEAASLGLACTEIGVDADALKAELSRGNVVICNVGPGDFTTGGHYIVIAGLADDGTLIVNDPYSAENSAKTWDVGQVIGQTKALYSYSLA